MERRSSAQFIPATFTLDSLRSAARHCRGCDLYLHATQTVFGEGLPGATVVLVGEQPGDREDKTGRPFVGPAGALLDQALEDAGIERKAAYVTNAVKHFKWEWHGKRRLHKRPSEREIDACTPWLLAELEVLKPKVVVCMGSTAARAAFGTNLRVTKLRGTFGPSRLSPHTLVTVHPSAILRLRGREEWRTDFEQAYADFVADLRLIDECIKMIGPGKN